MRIANLFAGFLMLVALFATAVPTASAAGTCFCNITSQGATQQASGGADAAACRSVCDANSAAQGSLWAADPSGYPSALLQCFSKASLCEKDMDGDGVNDGKFDSAQPAECPSGWHYCYPTDSEKYTLQISIPGANGGLTEVSNYGEYIGGVYKYLLGFSVTIAIVFVMIGGIRYVIGASSGDIGKAKDMIMKAVVGLVLLLLAYVILYTVNPQLISLQVPKMPMLRRVDLLTGGETCEALVAAGYQVDSATTTKGKYGAEFCGSTSVVKTRPDGSPASDGTTCMYSSCAGKSEPGASGTAQCASDGTTGWCLTCQQVGPGSGLSITPSAGLCASLDPADTFVNLVSATPEYDLYNVCGFTHDPWMFSSGLGATTAATATVVAGAVSGGTAAGIVALGYSATVAADAIGGSCASMSIDCKKVTTCQDYNAVEVANSVTDTTLSYLNWNSLGDPNIVEVCAIDPCQVGVKTGVACAYYGAEDTSQLGVATGCFPTGHSGAVDYTNYPAGP